MSFSPPLGENAVSINFIMHVIFLCCVMYGPLSLISNTPVTKFLWLLPFYLISNIKILYFSKIDKMFEKEARMLSKALLNVDENCV